MDRRLLIPLLLLAVSCGASAPSAKYAKDSYDDYSGENSNYSVAKVEMDPKGPQNYSSIIDYLKGRVPGLIIGSSQGTNSQPSIIIRGEGSFNSGNSPLFVVDGSATDNIMNIDPNDVYTVDVLKDASTAIYGSRGANGVIVIKTKSGREAEKARLDAEKAARAAAKAAKAASKAKR